MKKFEDYYLGLDLGTSSLGWAVTDEEYNILKFKKKFMWGTHLFETGKTATERRIFRTSRRRLKRKKQRIELLQQLFSNEISKVDMGFYQRLKESQYWLEDKSIKNKNTLFMDEDYKDTDFYNEFPTIYHLRKALIDGEESSFEVRKLYLAIAHILSNRGHFLFNGKIGEISEFKPIFEEFDTFLREEYEIELNKKIDKTIDDIKNILSNTKISRTKKKEELTQIFEDESKEKNKIKQEIFKLLVGNESKMNIVFDNDEYKEAKILFSKGNYDDKESEYESILGEKILLVQKAKAIYDWMLLQNILKESKYLSHSKVKSYESHKEDLKKLKTVIKKESPQEYKKIFGGKGLYDNYIKNNEKIRKKEEKSEKKILFEKIEKIFKGKEENEEIKSIINKIELDEFLLKQKIKDNAVIPRQVHQQELEKILENAQKYCTWLTEKDETGLTISEKIIKIFEFKIPYYIGPLNPKSPFAWIERKENIKITPWNFEEVVDISKTAEKFIKRMTNKCTYLPKKDVIPKNSLLYTKFTVLNELNNLKIRGEKISVELKQKVYENLFQKQKKIGMKQLIKYLKSEGLTVNKDEITGIDGTFNTSLSSYIDMVKIFGEDNMKKDSYKRIAEDIILWITLYGEERKLIKSKIKEKYKDNITEQELKSILKLKYKDWSRLSKEFLTRIEGIDNETGEIISIIEMMWRTNENLMELLSGKYTFNENIQEYNGVLEKIENINYKVVEELPVSPSVKKMIWKSLVIVKEIKKITKKSPKKIFIEMARDTQTEKKRTEKRKDKLIELYKNITKDSSIKELENNLKTETNDKLKVKKLYLYYLQLGRCMYSGDTIELSDLMNDSKYDIDHIYPQSKIKDDSFDNIVLVKREINGDKDNIYPLSPTIRDKCVNFWTMLKTKGFISSTKYERLTRTEEFSDEELAGFINRQIVETRQATKILADLLKRIFGEETRIIYVKAGITSDFRQKFGIYKFRELNDYHHAHDGYLNIIVGNIYNTLFTDNPINFIKERKKKSQKIKYNLRKVFDNENKVWKPNTMIPKIERYIYKISPLLTRASYEQKGEFSDQNISSAQDKLRPLKEKHPILSNIKYGGFNSIKISNFFIVEYTEKKERKKSIEVVPIYKKEILKTKEDLEKYCEEILKLENPKILIEKLKYKSLIHTNGHTYFVNGKSNNDIIIQNAIQLILSKENFEILRKSSKEIEYLKNILKTEEVKTEFNNKINKILRKNKNEKELNDTEVIEKIDNLYKEIYSKISDENGIFKNLKTRVVKYLKECYDKIEYKSLTNYEKIRIVQEIVGIINKRNKYFDLSDVFTKEKGFDKGYKIEVKTTMGKKAIFTNNFHIINQSPTGLFEKKIYLPK